MNYGQAKRRRRRTRTWITYAVLCRNLTYCKLGEGPDAFAVRRVDDEAGELCDGTVRLGIGGVRLRGVSGPR